MAQKTDYHFVTETLNEIKACKPLLTLMAWNMLTIRIEVNEEDDFDGEKDCIDYIVRNNVDDALKALETYKNATNPINVFLDTEENCINILDLEF